MQIAVIIPNRKHPKINLIQIAKGIGINGIGGLEANKWQVFLPLFCNEFAFGRMRKAYSGK
ncbi:hypothetical protein E9993_18415 [Labilibacter sediminis]|nr:hypothetical protein E9993_18415 [Labilibacter sediminis]